MNPQTIYLVRHASPDWGRTDIPYDIPPGPPLTPKGRQEAQDLGVFLAYMGVKKLYHSPLERAAHTAQLAASAANVPVVEKAGLAEWITGEKEDAIHTRFWPVMEAAIAESAQIGPVGLVTHGGPIAYVLRQLKIDSGRLEEHRRRFDHANPLPPAGVWAARRNTENNPWNLELIFTPSQTD